MQSKAKTVNEYLKSLSPERRASIEAVRKVILMNLPKGYDEGMQYGMIGYCVPLNLYPNGYLGQKDIPLPFAALASQKNYMAVYLMCIYGEGEKAFKEAYKATGKKMDIGKACIRFRKLEDLQLDLIGKTIAKVSVDNFIAQYEKSRQKQGKRGRA